MTKHRQRISLQEEAVLSYLVGLGPIGTEIMLPTKMLREDLKYMNLPSIYRFYQCARGLIYCNAIERIEGVKSTTYIVHKRPEEFLIYNERGQPILEQRFSRFRTLAPRIYAR